MGAKIMNNQEKLKQVIEEDINTKNCYYKIIEKIKKENMMKKNMWKWSLVPICLIIISGILYIKYPKNQIILDNKPLIEENNKVILNINNIDIFKTNIGIGDIAGSAIDITFEELTLEEKILTDLKIPNYLNNSRIIKRYDIDKNFIGYVLMYYHENQDHQVDSEIYIFLSKTLKEDYSDILYEEIGKLEDSKINNTDVKIAKSSSSYEIWFKYNDYNFNIETSNIIEQELVDLLLSIIK